MDRQGREERTFETGLFKEYLKSKLITLLDSIPGRKLLMLDVLARGPVNLIVEKKLFAEHGIPEEGGIVNFEVTWIDNNFSNVLIILPPNIKSMETLVQLYEKNKDKGNKKYYPVFWPKRSSVCKQYLEERGYLDSFELRDFSFDLIPLDHDLYSLEMKCFKELYIDQQYSIYNTVAESIHRLQSVFGKVRNIFGKGVAAKNIFQILQIKQNQIKIDDVLGDIEFLAIFDRNIDFLTPLLKQMTYQGLVDEFYGITGNYVRLPSDLLDEASTNKPNQSSHKTILLNGEKDYIFEETRILNISAARQTLKRKLKDLEKFQEETKNMKDLNLKNEGTKRLTTEKELLKKHINITYAISESMKTIGFHKELMMMQKCLLGAGDKEIPEYYSNLIPFGVPLEKLMRPLCLYSIIQKGIHKKTYRPMCEDIVQCYGAQHIVSLSYMAKLGLFTEQGGNTIQFNEIKKEMKLISEQNINHENPTDIAYAYGGFSPICPKLVELMLKSGWKNMAKALKLLPGDTLMPEKVEFHPSNPRPVCLVYFVGGVTYGEIAALRLLGRLFRKQMVIATTEVINGDSMLRSLIEKVDFS